MSWGLGWKRPLEIFKLTLNYGSEESGDDLKRTLARDRESGFHIELEWTGGEEEEQVALKLQSQVMVALPVPQDSVVVQLVPKMVEDSDMTNVGVEMKVMKRREPLRSVILTKGAGSGQHSDGIGVLTRLLRSDLAIGGSADRVGPPCGDHWKTLTLVSICGLGLSVSFLLKKFDFVSSELILFLFY